MSIQHVGDIVSMLMNQYRIQMEFTCTSLFLDDFISGSYGNKLCWQLCHMYVIITSYHALGIKFKLNLAS